MISTWGPWLCPVAHPETHTLRQATQHDCLPSLPGDGDKRIEIVLNSWGKKYFVPGRLEQRRQKKNSCTDTTGPTNQPRKDPFHLYSLSPHSHQFLTVSRGHPLSSLSGRTYRDTPKYYWYIDKRDLVRGYYVFSTISPFFIKKMCDSNISCSFSTII